MRNTSRNTPCVLGCCGPMLTSISSVRTSNSTILGSSTVRGHGFSLRLLAELAGSITDDWTDVSYLSADAVIFQRHLVVLAQRIANPIFRAQNSTQVGMVR